MSRLTQFGKRGERGEAVIAGAAAHHAVQRHTSSRQAAEPN